MITFAGLTPDLGARLALELDPLRQLRRVQRALAGRTVQDELRDAVANKRVLITGASSGIGREVALAVIAAGGEAILVARRVDELDKVIEQGGSGYAYRCDLSEYEQVQDLARKVLTDFDGVDILINNAGRSIRRTVEQSTDRLHDYERVMRLNYFGALWLTMPLVDQMRRTGGGHVINVSTMGTQLKGTPRFGAYMASKAALDQFAESAASETYHDGVRWTTVHLPLTQTEMIEPTAGEWRTTPKLSLKSGASMVLDAIIRSPVRVTFPPGVVLEFIDRYAGAFAIRLKAGEFRPQS